MWNNFQTFGNNKPSLDIQKTIKFKSSLKQFEWWNKEEKKAIPVKLPMKFLILAQTTKIWGFHSTVEKGIYSNEAARNNDILIAKCDGQTIAQGKYSEIKDQVKAMWGKYVACVYILLEGEVCKLELMWAAFSAYIESSINNKLWVTILNEFDEGKKWANKYAIPKFANLDDEIIVEDYEKAVSEGDRIAKHFKDVKEFYGQEAEVSETASIDIEAKLKESWDIFAEAQKDIPPPDMPEF